MKKTMDNSKKIILDLCGGTGSWSKPYKDAGYDVKVITLPDWDVVKFAEYDWDWENVYGILAAPPCTMFSRMNRTHTTPRDFRKGMETVEACLKIIWKCQYEGKRLKFWAIENPHAYLQYFLGKSPFTFQPYEFGHNYSKPTDIWGNFNFPKKTQTEYIKPKRKQSHQSAAELSPVPDTYLLPGVDKRTIARSITPQGFARAFYKANR